MAAELTPFCEELKKNLLLKSSLDSESSEIRQKNDSKTPSGAKTSLKKQFSLHFNSPINDR